jgi:hypothetical protein
LAGNVGDERRRIGIGNWDDRFEATNSAAWLAKPDPELPVGGSPMAAENRTFKAPA